MVTSVSVKPMAVCRLSIVPTHGGGDNSAIDAENCAESATMVTPQTMQISASHDGDPPNSNPIVAAQAPLTAIAAIVIVVRPSRSARYPATIAPSAPEPTVANVSSRAASGAASGASVCAKLACRNTPIQAHIA